MESPNERKFPIFNVPGISRAKPFESVCRCHWIKILRRKESLDRLIIIRLHWNCHSIFLKRFEI
ncbi:hypothetical protein DQM68_06155 [Leptospira mayottensis]|uniref:Uncharacterized protein n=2 Tax=Leptospira mayottensis TaxID=1137606 RepID=A0AA87SYT8_9LEPT|nr:hypothetical protein DQM68_06155 [Leptospira mayottensis]AXR64146.1 hypothetical protein DQM28_07865 [Leptospira mayottensis]AZQ03240.1 hypothetical protein LEP1GSC190_15535 [Leptospira mayottensis 200901116]EKS02256.1 hypothetical protein LEP1GSC125_0663 [Leptospira mayottensis 200901122]TGN06588.1 hypothetical protein EHR03_09900 [Leptospira mayottensis]